MVEKVERVEGIYYSHKKNEYYRKKQPRFPTELLKKNRKIRGTINNLLSVIKFIRLCQIGLKRIANRLVFIIGAIIGKEYIVCFLNGFIIEAECLVGNLLNFYSTIICCRL